MKSKKGIVFMAMGFELVAMMLASVFIGQALESKYDSKGLIIAGLSFLTLLGWLYHLIILLRKFQADEDK